MKLIQLNKLSCCVALMVFVTAVHGQADSIVVANTKWSQKKVAKGVVLKHYWFDHSLFGSNQNVSILEVKMNANNRIDVMGDPKVLKPTSNFGQEMKAIAGINGTFFDIKNGGSVDYIRVDGKMMDSTRVPKKGRTMHQKSALVCDENKLSIANWDSTANWEQQLNGEDVMVTGPLLLQHGQYTPLDTSSFNTARHPRTAVAVRGNTLLMITVDGRNNKAAGMSLPELASLLKWIGADDAVNLDGGGSTTMWIAGFPDNGIVNHPSDNKKMMNSSQYKAGMDLDKLAADMERWDHGSERPVANVLLISRKKK